MVLIALQFYATGSYQHVSGNLLHYSLATISRAVACVSLALCIKSKDFICFQPNLRQLKNDFFDIARMPGVVGCIDGMHVRIRRPYTGELAYVGRSKKHSINVQVSRQ